MRAAIYARMSTGKQSTESLAMDRQAILWQTGVKSRWRRGASLVFLLLVAAADPVRVEIIEKSCVGDQCSVRITVTNQTHDPMQGVRVRCVAMKGISREISEYSVDVPGTLAPRVEQMLRTERDPDLRDRRQGGRSRGL
jgi:hypothetical protein